MLSVDEAQKRIWAAFEPLGPEWLPLNQAHGRILSQDLTALRTQPPAAMSAMDGYAVRAQDVQIGQSLKVIGESPAGHPFAGQVCAGEAVRIFTGAVIPNGADAILIQENATAQGASLIPNENVPTGQFVRPAGLDFVKGWTGLFAGTRLGPREIGLAASMGHAFLAVRRKPRIALIATGDELLWPGQQPGPGEIISSNTPALAAMVDGWGGEALDLGIVGDNKDALLDRLRQAACADLIVTTGGASVGDLDLVQDAASQAGMALDFWKIRMRPGKPLIFGKLLNRPFIGLPGNPVSAAVCAIMFMRGALMTMLGLSTAILNSKAELSAPAECQWGSPGFRPGAVLRFPETPRAWSRAARQLDVCDICAG